MRQQLAMGAVGRAAGVRRWRIGAGLAAAESWLAGQGEQLTLWLPVCLGAGTLLYFALRAEPAGWIGPAAMLAALAAALAAGDRFWPRCIGSALFAAALGFAAAQWASARALPVQPVPRGAVSVEGTVREVEALPQGRRVTLQSVTLGGAAYARRIRLRLRANDPAEPSPGDRLRLRALLMPPPRPAYPGAWDVQLTAYFEGFGAYGYALGPATTLAHGPPGFPGGMIRALRATIARQIRTALPGPEGAVAVTLLTGMQTAIPPADRAAFRDSGLAHILAVAGLHIGIVMGLVYGVTRYLLACWEWAALRWPTREISTLAALAAGGFYMMLTGAHVPIMRSFAMAALVALGVLAGRRAVSLRGLGVAAVAILLIEPWQIVGVSFQMSFAAVLALIAGYEALRPSILALQGDEPWRRAALWVGALALTSLLAGGASMPFGAYHFGRIQLYFIPANMLAVPLTALWVMPAGMAALGLMPFGLERLALVPMGWGIDLVLRVGRAVSALPDATLPVPHMAPAGLALLALGMAWLGIWRGKVRLAGIAAIALGIASAWLVRPPDLLVSPDARLIGVRTAAGVFVAENGKDGFTRDAFRQFWGADTLVPLPEAGDAAGGAIRCGGDACLIRPRPDGAAALLLRGRGAVDCAAAAVLVAPEPARGVCPRGVALVDRFTVWRYGAYAIWLEAGGARLLSDAAWRGHRPWVIGPVRARRAAPARGLPMAGSDRSSR